jgi:hypothetical protein
MKTMLLRLTAVGMFMLLVGCCTCTGPNKRCGMEPRCDLEYRVDRVEFETNPPTGLQNYLNTMSKDGWKLVQVIEHEDWYRVVVCRPKKQS